MLVVFLQIQQKFFCFFFQNELVLRSLKFPLNTLKTLSSIESCQYFWRKNNFSLFLFLSLSLSLSCCLSLQRGSKDRENVFASNFQNGKQIFSPLLKIHFQYSKMYFSSETFFPTCLHSVGSFYFLRAFKYILFICCHQ